MRRICIVFARVPRLGTVKRRLAHDIGGRAALRFYRNTTARLLRALAADRRFRTILAQTPDPPYARWRVPTPRIGQGRGDLGERMQRACARFPHAQVAIVGSDIPALTANDVAAAFRALGANRAVFGPAQDGGYYLVGFGPRRPAHPFARVRWSTSHALADTLRNQRGPVALLHPLDDVDTAASYSAANPGKIGSSTRKSRSATQQR